MIIKRITEEFGRKGEIFRVERLIDENKKYPLGFKEVSRKSVLIGNRKKKLMYY